MTYASERWGRHYMDCPICQLDEDDPDLDGLCDTGLRLRGDSLAEMKARGV